MSQNLSASSSNGPLVLEHVISTRVLVSGITRHHLTHPSPTDTLVSYNQLHKDIFTKTSSLGDLSIGSIFNLKRNSVRHHASNDQSFNLLHGFSTVALVTGGGTGVGKAITGALASTALDPGHVINISSISSISGHAEGALSTDGSGTWSCTSTSELACKFLSY